MVLAVAFFTVSIAVVGPTSSLSFAASTLQSMHRIRPHPSVTLATMRTTEASTVFAASCLRWYHAANGAGGIGGGRYRRLRGLDIRRQYCLSRRYVASTGNIGDEWRNVCDETRSAAAARPRPWRRRRPKDDESPWSIGIVGGGLAGLSAAHHLIRKAKGAAAASSSSSSSSSGGMMPSGLKVTVLDKEDGPGLGGASAVAGGLLHPLSPRGTLLHLGPLALDEANELLSHALAHAPDAVLRDEIYRVALTERNASQLRVTAERHFQWSEWLDAEAMERKTGARNTLGGVVLRGGCRVVHVPSYLRGLWESCMEMSSEGGEEGRDDGGRGWGRSVCKAEWVKVEHDKEGNALDGLSWKERLEEFDMVVLSAGSGLFTDSILYPPLPTPSCDVGGGDQLEEAKETTNDGKRHANADGKMMASGLPIDLVRGQSVEVSLPVLAAAAADDGDGDGDGDGDNSILTSLAKKTEAVLCGKYVAPLPRDGAILVGATHEFRLDEPMSPREVVSDLRQKTLDLAPFVWEEGREVAEDSSVDDDDDDDDDDGSGGGGEGGGGGEMGVGLGNSAAPFVVAITGGIRVQSRRGRHGRMPIVGRAPRAIRERLHDDAWLFTGLSSRGLIYHGMFGNLLSDMMLSGAKVELELEDGEGEMRVLEEHPDLYWWRSCAEEEEQEQEKRNSGDNGEGGP